MFYTYILLHDILIIVITLDNDMNIKYYSAIEKTAIIDEFLFHYHYHLLFPILI
jgi:hypothetical protein